MNNPNYEHNLDKEIYSSYVTLDHYFDKIVVKEDTIWTLYLNY